MEYITTTGDLSSYSGVRGMRIPVVAGRGRGGCISEILSAAGARNVNGGLESYLAGLGQQPRFPKRLVARAEVESAF